MPRRLFITLLMIAGWIILPVLSAHAQESIDGVDVTPEIPGFDSPDLPKTGLNGFSPTLPDLKPYAATERNVELEAKLTADSPAIGYGLTWRIFRPIPDADGKLPMIASQEGGSASFDLPPGEYFVNVAFGRAGATKKLVVSPTGPPEKQILILDAGGMVLNAVTGIDRPIAPKNLRFSIYSDEVLDDGERGLLMKDVPPNQLVRLHAGTYHIVSNYGKVNAVIRANIQVQSGRITEAVIQHKAANVALKLVSSQGGEAIADTAWSVLTGSGDVLYESVEASPQLVLAEGGYTAIARNKDKIYQHDFTIEAGRDQTVEVLLKN